MTVLVLAGLLLGAPSEMAPREMAPATEPAAPAFEEPIVIEPAPLPVPVEPVGPGVEPLLIPTGPTTIALPPPPPPPDGSGRLVGGALTLGLGVGAFVAVSLELRRADGNPAYVASTFVPLGLTSFAIGTYLLVRGGKARANYRHWKQYTGYDVPRSGNGLLVGGTMTSVVGGVILLTGIFRSARGLQDPQTTALLSIGGATVVAGAAQLGLGFVGRERHRRWRRNSLFVLRPPWIAPIAARGLAVGVMGQF